MRQRWFQKLNPPAQLLILLGAIFLLLAGYLALAKYLQDPVVLFLSSSLKFCEDISANARHLLGFQDLIAENKRLNTQINQLNLQLSQLEEAARENQRLRSLLSLPQETLLKTCAAQVIARDSSNWSKTILINQGSSSGIKKGLPVISGEALAGRVIAVTPEVSKIALIVDFNSKIPAKILRTREEGVIFGTFSGGKNICKMKYIQDVQLKDRVISSGLGGIYPKGLLIGEVAAIEEEQNKLYKIADVQPAINFSRLEEVVVLIDFR